MNQKVVSKDNNHRREQRRSSMHNRSKRALLSLLCSSAAFFRGCRTKDEPSLATHMAGQDRTGEIDWQTPQFALSSTVVVATRPPPITPDALSLSPSWGNECFPRIIHSSMIAVISSSRI